MPVCMEVESTCQRNPVKSKNYIVLECNHQCHDVYICIHMHMYLHVVLLHIYLLFDLGVSACYPFLFD